MSADARNRSVLDRVLIVAFCVFSFTSMVFEQWIVFGVDLTTATDPFSRLWRWYAESFDPMMLKAPLSMRIMFGIDAWVFGPFYVVLAYAFIRRRNWIRIPAILFSSAMIYSVVVYYLMEALSEHAADTDLPMVMLISGPYTIVPFLLLYRMWDPNPFGDREKTG